MGREELYVSSVAGVSPGPLLPPSNGSWSQALWYVDPQNVTGNASDKNPGTLAKPLLTYARIAQFWGTISPILRQSTRIVFLSSHTDATDPVVFNPYVSFGTVSVESVPTVTAANVVLSNVTARSTVAGSNALLLANLGALAVADICIHNKTRGSYAFAYKASLGTIFEISQPYVAQTVGGTATPAQDNGWANGDVVDLLTLQSVNMASYVPSTLDWNASFTNSLAFLYQVKAFTPPGGTGASTVWGAVRSIESNVSRHLGLLNPYSANAASGASPTFTNCAILQSISGAPAFFRGGYNKTSGTLQLQGAAFSGFIFGVNTTLYGVASTFSNENYLDTSALTLVSTPLTCTAGTVIYGRANRTISLTGQTRLAINAADTFVGVMTAPQIVAGGLLLNGAALGSAIVPGTPSTINSGIASTSANLDAAAAAAGTAGVVLFNPGGASVAKAA